MMSVSKVILTAIVTSDTQQGLKLRLAQLATAKLPAHHCLPMYMYGQVKYYKGLSIF